ncbi:MAG: hypothetical protein ACNA8L_08945 [Luteolibacter sp.]
MKTLLTLTAAFSTFVTGAIAQQKISLQFISFPRSTNLEPIELLLGEGETKEVYIPGHELSPAYRVDAMTTIAVGKTVTNENGESRFQVYGQAPALAATQQIILLIRKGDENSDGFQLLPINGERSDFTGGSFLFFNASQIAVGGIIGDQEFALRPGQRRLLKPSATHQGGGCQVTLSYQHQEDWKKFYDTRWSVNPRYRSLIFFFQDPESGQLGVSPIVDIFGR